MKRYFLSLLQNSKIDPFSRILRFMLLVLSWIYERGISVCRFLYQSGVLSSGRLSVPVVSVGNLTWGGTGKTPFVLELVHKAQRLGKKPVVLLRGYGADEWKELSANLPGVQIGVGKNRLRSALAILAAEKADVVIGDDAFQHWALKRDWDIVLVNAARPFGNGYLIPRGELRETPQALERAHTLVLTHVDRVSQEDLSSLRAKLSKLAPQAELVEAVHEPLFFYQASSHKKRSLESFRGVSATAFSAIGSPRLFAESLRRLELDLKTTFEFPDHYEYREKDLVAIRNYQETLSIPVVITTEKDFSRVPELVIRVLDPWVLKVKMKIVSGEEKISKRLATLLHVSETQEKVYA